MENGNIILDMKNLGGRVLNKFPKQKTPYVSSWLKDLQVLIAFADNSRIIQNIPPDKLVLYKNAVNYLKRKKNFYFGNDKVQALQKNAIIIINKGLDVVYKELNK